MHTEIALSISKGGTTAFLPAILLMFLRKLLLACSISSLLLSWVWAQEGGGKNNENKNPFGKDKAAIEAGREQYNASCALCHGVTGKGGRGPQLAGAKRVREMPDKKIFDVIDEGIKGTEM